MALNTDRFQPGTTILYREVDENCQIVDVKPVTFVEDSDNRVALWLPLDTPSKRPILVNHTSGTPRRWTDENWSLTDSVWQWAELLILAIPGQRRATWIRWSRDRVFQGWCVNLQSDLLRTRLGFDIRDHQLDILVDPSRQWRWKDQEELSLCVEDGRMNQGHADEIRAEGLRAVAAIECNGSPFCEGWEKWKPDTGFPRPTLGLDWHDVSMYV